MTAQRHDLDAQVACQVDQVLGVATLDPELLVALAANDVRLLAGILRVLLRRGLDLLALRHLRGHRVLPCWVMGTRNAELAVSFH